MGGVNVECMVGGGSKEVEPLRITRSNQTSTRSYDRMKGLNVASSMQKAESEPIRSISREGASFISVSLVKLKRKRHEFSRYLTPYRSFVIARPVFDSKQCIH